MIKLKKWSVFAAFILIIFDTYSQKSDYVATDSSFTSGVKLKGGTARENAEFIRVKRHGKEVKYSPEQLSEYGFKDGSVYQSKIILVSGQAKYVFLERLEHGKITLYYYAGKDSKTYFLEGDKILEGDKTELLELSGEDDFRELLSEYTSDFDWKAEQFKLVRYNRNSLSKFIFMYNNGYNKPIPFPRFGLNSGYSRISLAVPLTMSVKELSTISFNPSPSGFLGVFADLPIGMGYYSVNIGMNFSKYGFSLNSRSSKSDTDVVVNLTSVSLPILIRYTWPRLVWRPFINTGTIYSYHLQNESNIYETTIDQNVRIINDITQQPFVSGSMVGYSFGIGLQRNLNYRNIASAEVRFNQFIGNPNTLQKNQFDILISFSF